MKYRMIALDLDGTLFDSTGHVPRAHYEAVKRAEQAGVIVVLCTGRSFREVRSAMDELNHQGPLVLASGALISDPLTGKTIHRAEIEPHLALQLVLQLEKTGEAVLVLLDPDNAGLDYLVVHPDRLTLNTRIWFQAISVRLRQVTNLTPEAFHHALRVGLVAPQRKMHQIKQELHQQFGSKIFAMDFLAVKNHDGQEDLHVLEVFAAGVNKWAGLTWLAKEHDIPLDQIAAIGDQINDREMIAEAGCGIAMGNAVPEVAQLADYQTVTNDDGGVAAAIDHLLAGRW